MTRKQGIPYLNCGCKVLCLNVYIAISEPMLPPSNGIRSRVFSGIRHILCFFFYLSIAIDKNPTTLIIEK